MYVRIFCGKCGGPVAHVRDQMHSGVLTGFQEINFLRNITPRSEARKQARLGEDPDRVKTFDHFPLPPNPRFDEIIAEKATIQAQGYWWANCSKCGERYDPFHVYDTVRLAQRRGKASDKIRPRRDTL